MSDASTLPPLAPTEVRHIVRACDRFEAAWKAEQRPRPEEFLGPVAEPVRSALLRQLLLLDWDYRRRAGDRPSADDYHARFPGDPTLVAALCREMTAPADPTVFGAGASSAGPDTCDWPPDLRDETAPAGDGDAPRYDLTGEIGRGGIGVVFRGRDRLLGRELAVKVLRTACRDRPDARQRFLEEARVGSQLQHPAIVPVYGLGWSGDGRPFFTMKLVEGHTLAALLRGRADPGQDLPRWLGVFDQVCQAMAYAHSKGVIHRDLKPANVMVGAFGEVQVMDWGFAKVAGGGPPTAGGEDGTSSASPPAVRCPPPAGLTESGTLMGTPAYMPPEQARGEAARLDSRADVFALGAVLCEILTGRPPYTDGSADEVCRQAAAGDLADAHARLDACGADEVLRELAKRCLAAERAARPADAGDVARAVTAYLASAQERLRQAQLERAAAEARAQEARAKEQAERHVLRLALALAAALLLGTAAAAWQAAMATWAKQDALDAKQEALTAAAAQREAKEKADAKEAETQAVFGFVRDHILAAARPEGQEGGLGRDVSLRKALAAALPAVDAGFAGQPLTEARLRMTMGESFYLLDEMKAAVDQFLRARALFTEHLGLRHPDTLASMNQLATSYHALGQYPDALEVGEQALAGNRAVRGPNHPDTLTSVTHLAGTYYALARHDDALKLRVEAVTISRAAFGPGHPRTLTCMNNLADSNHALGRYADALKLREEVVRLAPAALAPDHPYTLRFISGLAGSLYSVRRFSDAADTFKEVLRRQHDKLGPDHRDTLMTMNNLAGTYQQLGRQSDALPLFNEVLACRRAKLPPDHPQTLLSMNNLANCLFALGRHDEALKLREETLTLRRAKLPAGHPDTLMSMSNLALSYEALGRHTDALDLREQVLARQKVRPGPDHPDTLESMADVVASLVKLDRGAEAVPIIDECVRRAAGRPADPGLIPGVLELRLRHFAKAKDAGGCRATAELWEELGRTDAGSLYNAACFRAVTAQVFRANNTPPGAADQTAGEADRAMAWLAQAVAAGYRNLDHMEKDRALDALRGRDDFKQLLASLRQNAAATPPGPTK